MIVYGREKRCITFSLWLLLLCVMSVYAKEWRIPSSLEQNSSSVKSHDVKFIVEGSFGSANWKPGTSKIVGSDRDLLDYDTSGLKLFAIKGKINMFDTDVLEVEKFGTFSSGDEQNRLLKLREYNDDSSFEGANISLRAFLVLKYFYFYKYDFLDDLEYQYDYNNFYARAVNNIDAIYWWGKTNEGISGEDYVRLPKGSSIELTTEFNEHRFYMLNLKSYVKRFFLDTFKIGYFSTYWAKESYVGVLADVDGIPVIQTVLLESEGISFLLQHTIDTLHLDLKLRYNFGLDNYVTISHQQYDTNYYGIDLMADYRYDVYERSNYLIFAKANVMYSAKWFDDEDFSFSSESIDTDRVFSVGLSLGIMF